MMDDAMETAARRMLDRFGPLAAEILTSQARDLAARGDWPAQDRALLMLTRVEFMASRPMRRVA
ncbi:hypothetical protein [Paramagnetospirillum kuznetsovii]|nr:hypothetical protein [Paramagnetospirillum kuznetsovii]